VLVFVVLQIFIERYFVQGALKLKITMKGPKKEDTEKVKCEKGRRNIPKKSNKTNQGNKVIIL